MDRSTEAGASPELADLLAALAERYGLDLRGYRAETVRRRLQAAARRVGAGCLGELGRRLLADPTLFAAVADRLTVQVSEMFRDPEVLAIFRAEVVPWLRTFPLIKVWHAGCASGEEVYSTAILLDEEGLLDRCQLYGTDLSAAAIERAREGIYPAARLDRFAENHRRAGGRGELSDYLTVRYQHLAVAEWLRRSTVFFQHDLVTDHVFGDMQVVICRNVLIYFAPDLTQRVLEKLCAAVSPGGYLCLGAGERVRTSVGSTRLEQVSAGSRIYRIYRHPGGPLSSLTEISRNEAEPSPFQPVRSNTRSAPMPTSAPATAAPTVDEQPDVLLVDDHEENLIALEAVLGDVPCRLVRARSGNEALRQLLRRKFAVMLLDVQMPDMDGYEVARYARENPHTREVPIIFLTAAHQNEASMLRGYGSGAVDYLLKPFNPEVLRSKVRVFLDLFASRQRLNATMRELEQARKVAEQASQFKSQFLANMSHELRTPLNAIIGFGELLEDEQTGPLTTQQREFVQHIVNSGKHLVTLMNDILDLARIEAGRVEIRKERLEPAALIHSAREVVGPMATKKGVILDCTLDQPLPEVQVDPVRLKQILYNLLSNGIKFTPRGGRVRLQARASAQQLTIAVEDNGIGISLEDQARLFQEFERIEPASGPKQEGTGLGLALTRKLVELHGGRIEVESEPGRGSTFTLTLPCG